MPDFTFISDSRIDTDSAANTELFTFLRDNDEFLKDKTDGFLVMMAEPIEKFSGNPTTTFTNIDVSADIVPEEADMDVEWFDDSASTLNDITTAARLDDAVFTGSIMDDSADFIYVGVNRNFTKIRVNLAVFAAGAGLLKLEYFNGTSFVSASGLNDGTESGGNTFRQTGFVTWTAPTDWNIGAQAAQAGLDANLFYVRLSFTNSPSLAPNVDQCSPKPITARIAVFQITLIATSTRGILSMRRDGDPETSSTKLPTLLAEQQARAQLFVPLTNEVCEYAEVTGFLLTTAIITLVGYIA